MYYTVETMDCYLKGILSKLCRIDRGVLLRGWKKLSVADFMCETLEELSTIKKPVFIERFTKLFKERNCSWEDLHHVDLIVACIRSGSCQWTGYYLECFQGTSIPQMTTELFKDLLTKHLQPWGGVSVVVRSINDAKWIRVSFGRKQQKPLFAVHHPGSCALLINNAPQQVLEYFTKALHSTLKVKNVTQLSLKGRHVKSLLRMILNKYDAERANDVDMNLSPSKIINTMTTHLEKLEKADNIQDEDFTAKRKRLGTIKKTLGAQNLPVLQNLEFKLETKFRGHQHAPDMDKNVTFHCNVKYEGPNVLEGLKQLSAKGIASAPLTAGLGTVHKEAQNKFSLQEKRGA